MRARHYLILDCEPKMVLRFMQRQDLFAYCGVAEFQLLRDRVYTLDRLHNGCCAMRVVETAPRREQQRALPRVDNRLARHVEVQFGAPIDAQLRAAQIA